MPNYIKQKGDSITFNVSTEGSLDIYYQWHSPTGKVDAKPVLGKSSLKISKINSSDIGCHFCAAFNGRYFDRPTSGYKFFHSDTSTCFNLDVIEKTLTGVTLNSGNRSFSTSGTREINEISFIKCYISGYVSTTNQGELAKAYESGKFSLATPEGELPSDNVIFHFFNFDGNSEFDSSSSYPNSVALPGRINEYDLISKAANDYPSALIWKITTQDNKTSNDYLSPWERAYDLQDHYINELPTGNNQFSGTGSYAIPSQAGRLTSIEWEFPPPNYPPGSIPTGGVISGFPNMNDNSPTNASNAVFNAVINRTGLSSNFFQSQVGISPLSGETHLKSSQFKSNHTTWGTGRKYEDLVSYHIDHSGDIAINFHGKTLLESSYHYQLRGGNYNSISSGFGGGETIKYKEASLTGNVALWKVHLRRNIEGSYSSGTTTVSDFGMTFQDHYENIRSDISHPTNSSLIDLYSAAPVVTNSTKDRLINLHTQSSSNDGVIFVVNRVKLISGSFPSDHYYIGGKHASKPTGSFSNDNGYFARFSGEDTYGPFEIISGYGITGSIGNDLWSYSQLGSHGNKDIRDDNHLAHGHWGTKTECENWVNTTKVLDMAVCLNASFEEEGTDCGQGSTNCSGDWSDANCGCGEFVRHINSKAVEEATRRIHSVDNNVTNSIDQGDGYLQALGFLEAGETLRANLTLPSGNKTFMYGHLLVANLPNGTGSYPGLVGEGYAQAPLFKTYINGKEV